MRIQRYYIPLGRYDPLSPSMGYACIINLDTVVFHLYTRYDGLPRRMIRTLIEYGYYVPHLCGYDTTETAYP